MTDAHPVFFVTGASRSGTTLTCRILGNHSRVLATNELQFFGEFCEIDACSDLMESASLVHMAAMLLARQARDVWVKAPLPAETERAKAIVDALRADQKTPAAVFLAVTRMLAESAGKSIPCEQTPRNIFYATELLDAYSLARIIHVVRDPRAVLASQKNRWRVRKLGGSNVPRSEIVRLWFNYHPVTMSQLWNRATEAAVALESHPRVRLIRFEDLVAEPEKTVSSLCEWLDLSFETDMLDVPQWGSSNVRHETEGSGVSATMLSKWREVLTPGEIAVSEKHARDQMQKFSYECVSDGRPGLLTTIGLLLKYPLHVLGALLTKPDRFMIQLKAFLRPRRTS